MSRTSARMPPAATGGAPAAVAAVDVSVVVVTYNVREFLEQALESVARASGGLIVETFVVDNDSADGTAAAVRERFPDVRLIANEENVGFATANNQAIRESRGRYVLVLNPDTLVQEDTLRTLVAFMDAHPSAGAVGPCILNPDGTFAPESRRSFPTPAVAFYRISGLGRLFPQSSRFGRYNLSHVSPDTGGEVDALSGSCMMVRRDAVLGPGNGEMGTGTSDDGSSATPRSGFTRHSPLPSRRPAGLFDEDFFMYGEDLDWCYRIQQAGWTIHYTPRTQIIHYKGESTKKGDLRYVLLFYGAMLRFVEKHVRRGEAGMGERLASQALAFGLRAGIVARGAMAALGRVGRAVAGPVLDIVLAWMALAAAAALWSRADGFTFGASYYVLVLPVYAGLLALAVRMARPRGPIAAVTAGTAGAVLTVAAASFFAPQIAFSRATVLFGYAAAALLLAAWRGWRRRAASGPKRVLVVGSAAEAVRLRRLMDAPGRAPVAVVGYVALRPSTAEADAPPHAGLPRQIRDLARLHAVDEVVFAADSLTNTAILDGMRALRDVPVMLKILASGRDRIIGKASVEDVSAPLLDAERTVAPLRRSRRATEVPLALALLILGPVLRLAARLGSERAGRAAGLAARMPDVLAGRVALVGVDAGQALPPAAWGLAPGVVSILDTLAAPPSTIAETHRAYWFYARHQSMGLDAQVLWRALTR